MIAHLLGYPNAELREHLGELQMRQEGCRWTIIKPALKDLFLPMSFRQRACSEMLLQTAMQDGLLATDDLAPEAGVMSEAASEAIEVLLDSEL